MVMIIQSPQNPLNPAEREALLDAGIAPSIAAIAQNVVHAPAAATQATAAVAAVAGVAHICVGIFAAIAAGATAQTPIHVYLRDGASGSGTILWAGVLSAAANSAGWYEVTGISFAGTPGKAMTLEFEGVGLAATVQAVTLSYLDDVAA